MKIKRLDSHEIVELGDLVYVGENGDDGLRELQGAIGIKAGVYAYPIFRADTTIKQLEADKKELTEKLNDLDGEYALTRVNFDDYVEDKQHEVKELEARCQELAVELAKTKVLLAHSKGETKLATDL